MQPKILIKWSNLSFSLFFSSNFRFIYVTMPLTFPLKYFMAISNLSCAERNYRSPSPPSPTACILAYGNTIHSCLHQEPGSYYWILSLLPSIISKWSVLSAKYIFNLSALSLFVTTLNQIIIISRINQHIWF